MIGMELAVSRAASSPRRLGGILRFYVTTNISPKVLLMLRHDFAT